MSRALALLEGAVRRLAADDAFADALLGDLTERRRAEERRLGRATAARRYRNRLLSAALHLGAERLRPGFGGPRPRHPEDTGLFWSLRVDLAHAARSLWRRPAATGVAVATMTLAIGAATAVYSIADAVLLRALPYPEPERLVHLWSKESSSGSGYPGAPLAALDPLRSHPEAFARVEAYDTVSKVLTGLGEPIDLAVVMTTPGLFAMLGAEPVPGRGFTAADRDEPVVIVSQALWRQRLGGTDAIGREILLDDVPYRILGVAPAWFRYPNGQVDAWVPLPSDTLLERPLVDARLAVPRDDPAIDAALRGTAAVLRDEGQLPDGWRLDLFGFPEWREFLSGAPEHALWILLGAVAFVVVVAAANLANLRLADVLKRERQMAVAAALGAGRRRILRQLLLESVLIALTGAALGALLARALVDRIVALAPAALRFLHDTAIGVDERVLVVALGATAAAGILGGLAPALRAAHTEPATMLAAGGRGATSSRGQRRLRTALVLFEVAISTSLLIGSGLLLKSFARLQTVDPGFAIDGLVSVELSLGTARYPDAEGRLARLDEILAALRALPGIEAGAAATGVPPRVARLRFMRSLQVEAEPDRVQDARDFTAVSFVSPDYFATLGLPALRGRVLRADETEGTVVISETFAGRVRTDGDAVGARIRFGARGAWLTVVGVVPDVRQSGYDEAVETPELYRPLREIDEGAHFFGIVLRTERRDGGLAGELRATIRALAPDMPILSISSIRERYSEDLARQRFNLLILGGLATIGTLLATLGLYGVISYRVNGAVRELGIRIALGAAPGRVFGSVVGRGMALACAGIAAGSLAGFWLSRLLESLLYDVSARDVTVFAAIAGGSLLIAAIASGLPARRATRVDPVETLRRE